MCATIKNKIKKTCTWQLMKKRRQFYLGKTMIKIESWSQIAVKINLVYFTQEMINDETWKEIRLMPKKLLTFKMDQLRNLNQNMSALCV